MTVLGHDIAIGGIPARRRAGSQPSALPTAGPELRDLLAKPHDRLFADAGLSREELLGPWHAFWRDWNRVRQPWNI